MLTPLNKIKTNAGQVMHALKASEESYSSFGEAYFSYLRSGSIRAWKYHKIMTANLIVPFGDIKIVFPENNSFTEVIVGENNYCRVTIPSKVWFGFMCVSKSDALILNIANVEHQSDEVINEELTKFNYEWKV